MGGTDDELSAGERAMTRLLDGGHLTPPDALPVLVAEAAAEFGARDVELLLIDHGQSALVPFGPAGGAPLGVDSTVAGRAYRQVEMKEVAVDDGHRLWLPLLDGLERLGVLGLTLPVLDDLTLRRARAFSALVAELIITKSLYGDALTRTARLELMQLPAEIQWSLMPPLTAGTERVTISAMLEPSYEVGGDLVDYSLSADEAHLAVLDAMGHGLRASVLSAVAVGAYRNARREPLGLRGMVEAMEDALVAQFDHSCFVTALVARFDLHTGRLEWINAGHPPPLLLRDGRIVKTLDAEPDRPLGYGLNPTLQVHEEDLQPGDRIVAYTDGVVEARGADGEQFGVERLGEFVVRASAAGEPAPETMRRLSKAILAHQQGKLQDDATHVMLEWGAEGARRVLPSGVPPAP